MILRSLRETAKPAASKRSIFERAEARAAETAGGEVARSVLRAARAGRGGGGCAVELLPGVKEIGQFGIMDIIEERRISDDHVDAAVRQARIARCTAGEIDAAVEAPAIAAGG